MNNLISLAWRNVSEHRLRTALSATAVSAGVAMTLAADYVSNALLAALTSSGEGDLQITHGFIVEQFDQMLNLIGVVLLVAAAFLVFNAFAMTVTQRRQQFGLLRVLGATRRQILRLALLEGMLLAGVGTVLGLLLGPLLGRGIVLGMRLTLGDLLVFGQGQIGGGTMVTATFLGLSITLLAVFLPARHATQIPPIVATHNALAESMPAQRTAPRVPLLLLAVLLAGVATRPGDWLPAPWNLWLAMLGVLVWLAAGVGSAVIIVLVYGGRSWGVLDLALWPAAGATALTALAVGAVGVIVAPVISAAAAHWPIKRLLRETTVGLLD